MTRRALIGWLLFTASGVLFFAAGLRDRDALTMITSAVWTLGCIMFLTDGSGEQQPVEQRPSEQQPVGQQPSGQPGVGDQYLRGD